MKKVPRRRLPLKPVDTKTEIWDNTVKADGAHLGMGSSEYRERIADLQGLDEFEQREARLAEANIRMNDENPSYNVEKAEEAQSNAEIPKELRHQQRVLAAMKLTPTERNVSNQIYKMSMKSEVETLGQKMAAKTEAEEDDLRMKRRLPKVLEEQVYDEGVSRDDYYPGMETIEKFL